MLTLTDDDDAPTVTLELARTSIKVRIEDSPLSGRG